MPKIKPSSLTRKISDFFKMKIEAAKYNGDQAYVGSLKLLYSDLRKYLKR